MTCPSLPAASIASTIKFATEDSPLAEIVATFKRESLSLTSLAESLIRSIIKFLASSIPSLSSVMSKPAALYFKPSPYKYCASTVAVVVPSPACSAVLLADSLIILAPKFSTSLTKFIA